MIVNRHHHLIQKALDRTMLSPSDPEFISRLIINVPPGYSKTIIASINYPARGIALNPMARFLHLSYSDNLVLLNSNECRHIVKSMEFQRMWPTSIKEDTDSKKIWHTEAGGGIVATSTHGQVIGFRAGHMDSTQFTGAIIIDDPVKPEDAYSETLRSRVNENYSQTIASRLAVETVPIVVIMQRIHRDDMSGYLLKGGSGEKWHHLFLPVIIDNKKPYPKEYTHGIQIPNDLADGWLWPFKHTDKHEKALRAHRRRFLSQYMQTPIKMGEEGGLWNSSMIEKAKSKPLREVKKRVVVIDPAVSNNKNSDMTGIVVVALDVNGEGIVEADYTIKASPNEWVNRAINAYHKHNANYILAEVNQGGDLVKTMINNADPTIKVETVHASVGKFARAEPVAALYEQGKVAHAEGLDDLETQLCEFVAINSKESPDRLDCVVYGLTYLMLKNHVTFRVL